MLEPNAVLTTQESLEALAGRSPDGKPLVFVSQQDYDALRNKYEALLESTKHSKRDLRLKILLLMGLAAMGAAIVVAVAYRTVASAHVEPYGRGFYTANDVAGVHAANAFCMARKEAKQMRPLYATGASGLLFECVKSDDEAAADKREAARKEAEPWQFTPSAENRARCIELRDQWQKVQAGPKGKDLNAILDAAKEVEKLQDEAENLQCLSKL
jgi:hypothetical protein